MRFNNGERGVQRRIPCSTVVLISIDTQSIARVGTSAIITLRRELAIDRSQFDSVNLTRSPVHQQEGMCHADMCEKCVEAAAPRRPPPRCFNGGHGRGGGEGGGGGGGQRAQDGPKTR